MKNGAGNESQQQGGKCVRVVYRRRPGKVDDLRHFSSLFTRVRPVSPATALKSTIGELCQMRRSFGPLQTRPMCNEDEIEGEGCPVIACYLLQASLADRRRSYSPRNFALVLQRPKCPMFRTSRLFVAVHRLELRLTVPSSRKVGTA